MGCYFFSLTGVVTSSFSVNRSIRLCTFHQFCFCYCCPSSLSRNNDCPHLIETAAPYVNDTVPKQLLSCAFQKNTLTCLFTAAAALSVTVVLGTKKHSTLHRTDSHVYVFLTYLIRNLLSLLPPLSRRAEQVQTRVSTCALPPAPRDGPESSSSSLSLG